MMKHLGRIQSEFLKAARKWDDLSYDDQKAYLKRHPKSKRKITAKPTSGESNQYEPPKHGTAMGSSDQGPPENFTNEELSAALDKINEARKNGTLDQVKKELPKGIIPELNYSKWKYVDQKHRKGIVPGFENFGDLSHLDSKVVESNGKKYLKLQNKNNPTNHLTLIPEDGGYSVNVTSGSIENPSQRANSTWYGLYNKTFSPEEVLNLKGYLDAKPETSNSTSKSQKQAEKAEKNMQAGNVISVETTDGKHFYKLDSKGRLWSSKLENTQWSLGNTQELPQEIKNGFEVVGPQLENYNRQGINTYFKTTKPVAAWLPSGKRESVGWYGSAELTKAIMNRQMLPEGTQIQLLHGGDFAVIDGKRVPVKFTDPKGDPHPFEKVYNYNPEMKQLPLSALNKTDKDGNLISKAKKLKLPAIGSTPPKNETIAEPTEKVDDSKLEKFIQELSNANIDLSNPKEINDWMKATKQNFSDSEIREDFPNFNKYDAKQIADAYSKSKSKDTKQPEKKDAPKDSKPKTEKKWPENEMKNSFTRDLKSLFSSKNDLGYMVRNVDDEPYINKDQNGNIQSIELGFRDLGNWIDRPGEEDDDYPSWSEESEKKYFEKFDDWAKRQSWFDKKTMKPFVTTGEKAWAYFGIDRIIAKDNK